MYKQYGSEGDDGEEQEVEKHSPMNFYHPNENIRNKNNKTKLNKKTLGGTQK